ncbi:DUF7543 family protein [Halosegnis marinus]|uniref:Uncharacterized protein n=1 Tax=Halosegnis marinus TaxID=3034023 RepID=A0ABD5ZLF3_9EURY|nr:hypothetical protein [Halosegnis sp. DT85]
MGWERTRDDERRIEWERTDGYARVVARETATGTWAVSLDRLEQAPDGQTYDHRTAPDRDAALDPATALLDANEVE